MSWKKKLREYKGRNNDYSLRKKLKKDKKITDDFEIMLSTLTLEEIIGLRLELASLYINNKLAECSLFSLIKSTLNNETNSNSLISFSDNSSVIRGFNTNILITNRENYLSLIKNEHLDLVLTAETHNFPTLISPFEGASTGVGGRIRDNQATGRGAYIYSSICGYNVGKININNINNINKIENFIN